MEDYMNFNPRDLGAFNPPEQQTEQTLIYKAMPENSKSEDGIYRATLRFVYNVHDMRNSIVEKQTYSLHDADGYFRVDSALSVGDRNCPIFKAWKKLHYSEIPGAKELGSELFDKQFSRWCLVQVVNDANRPELNSKYMFFKLPKFLWDSMQSKMNPAAETGKSPVPVMDFLQGREISLEVKPGPDDPVHPERKRREISYNTSEITDDICPVTREDGSSFLTDDEQGIFDTYCDMLRKVNKMKDAKKRDAEMAKLAADPITEQVKAMYMKVAGELKNICPDIMTEIAFNYYDKSAGKFWDDATTERVNKFIAAAVQMRKPWEPAVQAINEVGAASAPAPAQETPAEAPQVVNQTADSNELPF